MHLGARLLALLVIPLLLTFTAPLWNISMLAPQYPQGLTLDIYAHKVEGGRSSADIRRSAPSTITGMAPIDRAALSDLDWIPSLGVLAI